MTWLLGSPTIEKRWTMLLARSTHRTVPVDLSSLLVEGALAGSLSRQSRLSVGLVCRLGLESSLGLLDKAGEVVVQPFWGSGSA